MLTSNSQIGITRRCGSFSTSAYADLSSAAGIPTNHMERLERNAHRPGAVLTFEEEAPRGKSTLPFVQ
jgi:hypothetical protein